MNIKNTIYLLLIAGVAITICISFPDTVLARAGGGGSGGKGGGLVTLIIWPILLIYSAFLTRIVLKKNKESKILLAQIEQLDSSWDLDKIKSRIEIAFFKIQEAWMKRDQDIAKEYMSERLYLKHKTQTDQMMRENRKNILEGINLKEAKIVEVADFKDDSKDRIWVYLKGDMIDYIVDSVTNDLISGDEVRNLTFKELWKFIKNSENNWVLDEIDQIAEISDLKEMNSFSQELENTSAI